MFVQSKVSMVASTHSNSYCQAWIKGHAGKSYQCILPECGRHSSSAALNVMARLLLMSAGRNNTTRAHAEHHPCHAGCSLDTTSTELPDLTHNKSPHPLILPRMNYQRMRLLLTTMRPLFQKGERNLNGTAISNATAKLLGARKRAACRDRQTECEVASWGQISPFAMEKLAEASLRLITKLPAQCSLEHENEDRRSRARMLELPSDAVLGAPR